MAGTEGKITCVNNEESGKIGKIKEKAGLNDGTGDINSKGDSHLDGEKRKLTELMADRKKDKNDDAPSGEGDKMFKKPVKRPGDAPLDLTVSTSKKSKDDDPDLDDSELHNSKLMGFNDDDDDEEDEEDEEEDEDEEDEEEDEEDEDEDDDEDDPEEET